LLFFLRRLPTIAEDKLNNACLVLVEELKRLRQDPFEKHPFLYLDYISCLESKVNNIPVETIIRQKLLKGILNLGK